MKVNPWNLESKEMKAMMAWNRLRVWPATCPKATSPSECRVYGKNTRFTWLPIFRSSHMVRCLLDNALSGSDSIANWLAYGVRIKSSLQVFEKMQIRTQNEAFESWNRAIDVVVVKHVKNTYVVEFSRSGSTSTSVARYLKACIITRRLLCSESRQ